MTIFDRALRVLRECADRLTSPHLDTWSRQKNVDLGNSARIIAHDLEPLTRSTPRVLIDWPTDSLSWDNEVPEPGQGHAWIQWKGTNVCMDVHCPCGAHGHVDDDFAYFYRCWACDKTFALGATVRLYECSPEAAIKYGERAVHDRELEPDKDLEETT